MDFSLEANKQLQSLLRVANNNVLQDIRQQLDAEISTYIQRMNETYYQMEVKEVTKNDSFLKPFLSDNQPMKDNGENLLDTIASLNSEKHQLSQLEEECEAVHSVALKKVKEEIETLKMLQSKQQSLIDTYTKLLDMTTSVQDDGKCIQFSFSNLLPHISKITCRVTLRNEETVKEIKEIDNLLEALNRTGDWVAFLCAMRESFQRLLIG